MKMMNVDAPQILEVMNLECLELARAKVREQCVDGRLKGGSEVNRRRRVLARKEETAAEGLK